MELFEKLAALGYETLTIRPSRYDITTRPWTPQGYVASAEPYSRGFAILTGIGQTQDEAWGRLLARAEAKGPAYDGARVAPAASRVRKRVRPASSA